MGGDFRLLVGGDVSAQVFEDQGGGGRGWDDFLISHIVT